MEVSAVTRLAGKVALITGAARGQGRSHAIRLAEEGADIIALDICAPLDSLAYQLASEDDLRQTALLVEGLDRRCEARVCDVRSLSDMTEAVADAVTSLGRLDIVSANAGVISYGRVDAMSEGAWRDVVDTNLTGVFNTVRAALPHIQAGGRGGSIAITASALARQPTQNTGHYSSAKWGLRGLVRTLALELGAENIRVNAILPGMVNTDLTLNDATFRLFRPELENPTEEDFIEVAKFTTALGIPYVEAIDISNALAFLVSDEARYITGAELSVDAGTAII
jgi:SDR family mycofactocin-dependent oxidoreductase